MATLTVQLHIDLDGRQVDLDGGLLEALATAAAAHLAARRAPSGAIAAAPAPAPAPAADAPAPVDQAPRPAPGHLCSECGETFRRKDTLAVHQRTLHAIGLPPTVDCVECGTTVVRRRRDQRFCSAACRHRAVSREHARARRAGTGADLACPDDGCAEQFATQQGLSAHRRAAHGWQKPLTPPHAPLGERRCDHCGAAFTPDRSTGRYCSADCRKAHLWARTAEQRRQATAADVAAREPRTCEWCQQTFTPVREAQRYCTSACGNRASAARQRARNQAPAVEAPAVAPRLPAGFPRTIDQTRPNECPVCGTTYAYGHQLDHHVEVTHAPLPTVAPVPAKPLPVAPHRPTRAEEEARLAAIGAAARAQRSDGRRRAS